MTVPNALTILRLLMAPVVIWLFLSDKPLVALIVSIFASLTDLFDGMLARALKQESYLGALLDPVADKFFEMILLGFFYLGDLVPWWYLIVFCTRNIAQLLSIPILMWFKKINFKVEPKMTAKLASTWSLIIINLILIGAIDSLPLDELFYPAVLMSLIVISTIFEVIMLATYLPRFWAIYQGKHDTFN